jgi:hypothetical protein
MIGCFILGGLFFLAASKFMRHRHGFCGVGHHGRWGGHHGWHGGGGWGRSFDGTTAGGPDDEPGNGGGFFRAPWSGGRGMPFYLRFLSQRLDASPGQERAIADAVKQFRSDVEPLAGEAGKTRADLAAAMRKSSFDEVMLGELFARHDEVLEKGRRAVVGLGARLHDALDERQRERLATLIERGPRFGGHAW